ncbi:MAG: hypothetical protein V1489_03100 [Candidatus Liptonbacteria bacterium]
MQNKYIVYVMIAVVVIAGVMTFVFKKPASAPSLTAENTVSGQTEITSSLTNLLGRGIAQKCTFNETSGEVPVGGTVYVGNNMMRGDFKSTISGSEVQSHIIAKDGRAYVWSDLINQGISMALAGASSGTAPSNNESQVSLNQPYKYTCNGWTYSAEQFNLPENVTFTGLPA